MLWNALLWHTRYMPHGSAAAAAAATAVLAMDVLHVACCGTVHPSVHPVPFAVMWTLVEHLERRVPRVYFAHEHAPIADRLQGPVVVDHR
uniref:Putative secreted peptide n=1 Tax=Anopheles braziliensis TaxID=58242 RepID=A0A2M3ZMM5_9DIPT